MIGRGALVSITEILFCVGYIAVLRMGFLAIVSVFSFKTGLVEAWFVGSRTALFSGAWILVSVSLLGS